MRARSALVACLLAMALLSPSGAEATTAVRSMSIAEGENFEFSPFAFEVTFSERVHLLSAQLVDQEGRTTPIDISFYRRQAQEFVIELPVLIPHGYRLSWRVRGAKGEHEGSVRFLVKGCLDPRLAQVNKPAS